MTGRNRIEMNSEIFSLLVQHAVQDKVVINDSDKSRYVRRLSTADSKLMSEAAIIVLSIGRRVRIIKLQFEGEIYFCFFGMSEPEELPEGMIGVDMTPAIFVCAALACKILPKGSGAEIKQAIELDFMGVAGYEGHDLNVIMSLFPAAYAYKGSSNFEYQSDLNRIAGNCFARTYLDGPIFLETTTIAALADFFEGASSYLPYGNLVRGMIAISWESLYLELYRCLEQLYACTRVAALRAEWCSEKSIRELAMLLENHLSWRPKEDDSLTAIIQQCNPATVRSACTLLAIPLVEIVVVNGANEERERKPENLAKSVSNSIYALRNHLVHYRPAHVGVAKGDQEWNGIIRLMLELVSQSYELFGRDFFAAQPSQS